MEEDGQFHVFRKEKDLSPDEYLEKEDKNSEKIDKLDVSLVEEDPYQRETTEVTHSHVESQRQKSFLVRNISPLQQGSLRSSVLTMVSSTIGAGLLSLPKAFSSVGLVTGMIGLTVFGVLTGYTYRILNELVMTSGKKSYANVVSHFFGKKVAGVFVNFTIFATLSVGILYGSVTWLFLAKLLKTHGFIDFKESDPINEVIDEQDPLTVKWRYICSGIMFLFILPFVYQRNISSLRYVSLLIVVSVFYTIVVAIIQFWPYYSTFKDQPEVYEVYWISAPFSLAWFKCLASFILAQYSHALFFYVRGDLMNKTTSRINKLINVISAIVVIFFAVFSAVGYVSLGSKQLPTIFTLRKPLTPDSPDVAMKLARIIFFIAALLKVSILVYPAREQIYIYYKIERSTRNQLIFTVLLSGLVFSVPCYYPKIDTILDLVGGLMLGALGYSIPLALKIANLRKTKGSQLSIAFHAVLLLIVVTIQGLATYEAVH